jgi:hypothetical protein
MYRAKLKSANHIVQSYCQCCNFFLFKHMTQVILLAVVKQLSVSFIIMSCFLLQSGRSCLGEIIYRYITAEQFSPECLLDCLDLSSEHHTLEVANRIEAAIHVWRLKGQKKSSPQAKSKKSWGGKVKGLVGDSKSNVLSQRADGLLQSLRLRHPGLPQTSLDMNKIQYNKVILHIYSFEHNGL